MRRKYRTMLFPSTSFTNAWMGEGSPNLGKRVVEMPKLSKQHSYVTAYSSCLWCSQASKVGKYRSGWFTRLEIHSKLEFFNFSNGAQSRTRKAQKFLLFSFSTHPKLMGRLTRRWSGNGRVRIQMKVCCVARKGRRNNNWWCRRNLKAHQIRFFLHWI